LEVGSLGLRWILWINDLSYGRCIFPEPSFFSELLFDEDWAVIGLWGVGILRGSSPSGPLYYVSEVLNRIFNLGFCFEWHMESDAGRDEVAKIVPVGLSIA
jgi:hypothetical protein